MRALIFLPALALTSCGERLTVAIPDQSRITCITEFPSAPTLPALESFVLPDGRRVVLESRVFDREVVTARYIIDGRAAWADCRAVVVYVNEWAGELGPRR